MARYDEESKTRRVPFLGNWAPLEYTTFFNLFFLSFSTTHYLTKRRKGKRENRDISALLRGESQAVYHSRDESAPQDFSVGIAPHVGCRHPARFVLFYLKRTQAFLQIFSRWPCCSLLLLSVKTIPVAIQAEPRFVLNLNNLMPYGLSLADIHSESRRQHVSSDKIAVSAYESYACSYLCTILF
jgi:hypothetical protein